MALLLGDPVTFDDSGTTFTDSGFFNYEFATKRTALASGTVDTVELLTVGDASNVWLSLQLAVYADDSGYPGALLGYGEVPTNPATADGIREWVTATGLSVPVVEGTDYWLGVLPIDDGVRVEDAPGASYDNWYTQFDPSFPTTPVDPFPPITGDPDIDPTLSTPGIGIRATGGEAPPTPPPPGLEWHITGLWYPDAESVAYYGQIADPIDGEIVIPLDDSRTASVTVSAWDPIVDDIIGHAYARMVKVYYRDTLVFWGPYKLGDVKEDDDGNPVVQINAVDQSLRMVQHFLRRGDTLSSGTLSAPNGDKGTVSVDHLGIRLVRDAANNIPEQTARGCPDLGVIDGTNDFVAAPDDLMGVTRGDEVWNTIVELSQSLGPDFELEPIEGTVGAYAQLNTYIAQGTDKTASVKLHYATGLDNLAKLEFTEGSKYVTHVHVLDREKKYRFTELNLAASAETGQYTMWVVTDFDSTNVPADDVERVLRNYGRDIIKAYSHPLTVVQVTLPVESDADGEYHHLDAFSVGDIVEVAGRLGRIELAAGGHRITQVRLAQSGPENGVAPELTLVPSVSLTVDDTDTEG